MNNPELFAKLNDQVLRDNASYLDKYLHLVNWKDDETVMDIGIGDGKTTMEVLLPRLPKNFKKLVGSDISEDMLKFVKKNYDHHKKEFLLHDVAGDELQATVLNAFDHIFSFYCLQFTDQRISFANIFKMLKPGGELLAAFCATIPPQKAFEILSEDDKWAKYKHAKFFTIYYDYDEPEKQMEKLLTEAGFENVLCRIEEVSHFYQNYEVFKGFFTSLNPAITQIPEEDRNEYVNKYMEEIQKHEGITSNGVENGKETFMMTIKVFVVYGSKPVDTINGSIN